MHAINRKCASLKVKENQDVCDGSSYHIRLYGLDDRRIITKGEYMPEGEGFWGIYDGMKEISAPYNISAYVVAYRESLADGSTYFQNIFGDSLKARGYLNSMEDNMTDYGYLDVLINEVKELRSKTAFIEIDIAKCGISYMPTKKTSFVGFKQGYSDYLIKIQKGIKETEKIRSTTKDYLRLIKNEDDELIQIELYSHGKLDCLFQVHWIEGARYLFPYSNGGGFYPTYTYVTKYEDNCVVEEYMVDGSQIVHETYTKNSSGQTDYNYINYVSGGKYPVLEERKGKFYFNPLTYVEKFRDSWLNHREI